jgi:GNAT superfamily N-acetyltransferase
MTKIEQIWDVNEIIAKWHRLWVLADTDEVGDSESVLQMYLHCLTNGAVFLVYGDKGLMGTCCLERCPKYVNLLSLPRDNGAGMAKMCIETAKQWAKEEGYDEIRVVSTKLNGSSFRYFEKSLGFHRHSVTFKVNF